MYKRQCKHCGGDGIVKGDEVVEINIPAGVEDGIRDRAACLVGSEMCIRDSVRDVTERFAEAAGGGWARTFAVNIRAAYIRGRDIHISLEEELKQISETKQLMQERMRSNNESVRMTFFMVPATLLITTVLAVRQMNMPLLQLIKAQFSNSTGCMLFMAILLLFIFNIVSTQIFLKKRTDL